MSQMLKRNRLTTPILLLFLLSVAILSQPALDPGSTVDPATGRMMFQLPLGTVRGAGIDYPINLGYAAGIQYYQEASSVGLGFSVDPPC
ncbi:MAG: hypothetical protein JXA18_13705 [Chitinispirillaceae bacterium]|nr:hypothetical protein [Chitinispirillaceae bacterium]